ncbi:uncharacterized protein PRCAT00004299001 [Priceomyces carsonii]|uniref:uncharacterized protein n=1 Tax=Priceomyces carsonii TaxID=28549 RepID=UPI002ED80EC9|nr:unnamed protein product [Priceomyces carsonii]
MIVRRANDSWFDSSDPSKSGTITRIYSQEDYDNLLFKPKIGIVCAPDDIDTTEIGIPYVEMEPTDEDFYKPNNTIYNSGQDVTRRNNLSKRIQFTCIIRFCRNTG